MVSLVPGVMTNCVKPLFIKCNKIKHYPNGYLPRTYQKLPVSPTRSFNYKFIYVLQYRFEQATLSKINISYSVKHLSIKTKIFNSSGSNRPRRARASYHSDRDHQVTAAPFRGQTLSSTNPFQSGSYYFLRKKIKSFYLKIKSFLTRFCKSFPWKMFSPEWKSTFKNKPLTVSSFFP